MKRHRRRRRRIGGTIVAAVALCTLGVSETLAAPPRGEPWAAHIHAVDDALAKGNVAAAARAWRQAYIVALGSRRWEGLVEVARADLRLGAASGSRRESERRARALYLSALFRARQEGSVDGVLRAAEGFAALGDREVVEQSIRLAERLAAKAADHQAPDRVRAFKIWWTASRLIDDERVDLMAEAYRSEP